MKELTVGMMALYKLSGQQCKIVEIFHDARSQFFPSHFIVEPYLKAIEINTKNIIWAYSNKFLFEGDYHNWLREGF